MYHLTNELLIYGKEGGKGRRGAVEGTETRVTKHRSAMLEPLVNVLASVHLQGEGRSSLVLEEANTEGR